MKIFISWSGKRSNAVAEKFSDWLKCVIQASQPWISTRDIDRGAIWLSEINNKLSEVSIGIVFLTQENKNKPWILFETGALAKGLSSNRVCTFLIDLNPSDLEDPLAQFNHTTPNKSGLLSLTKTINSSLENNAIDEKTLERIFETYWPQFESDLEDAINSNPITENIEPRTEKDILSEILNNTRSLTKRIRKIEDDMFLTAKNESSLISNEDQIKLSLAEKAYKNSRAALDISITSSDLNNSRDKMTNSKINNK